ncbi:interferon-induced very large GTPase 1-like [Mytilus galloprovincialis]|uniref:interferon-induced very large GTPase 1-like n=1 Tax=Mytilus galloprovincialis TaxID=29158 RepID=UPI003F7B5F05
MIDKINVMINIFGIEEDWEKFDVTELVKEDNMDRRRIHIPVFMQLDVPTSWDKTKVFEAIDEFRLNGTSDMNIRIKAISTDDLSVFAEIANKLLCNVGNLRSEVNKMMSTILSEAAIDTTEHAELGVNLKVPDRSEALLDVNSINKRPLPSDKHDKDCVSIEQLTTPLKPAVSNESTETHLRKSDESSTDIKTFINLLGLDEFYPEKMQVRDVMKIELSVKSVTLKNIAFMFIKNILMINFNGRDLLVQENLKQKYKPETGETYLCENYLENILEDKTKASNREINPLDLTIAVFKCASPMLKHTLASKFFTCKIAVPFVFPKNDEEDISISLNSLQSVFIECSSNGRSFSDVSLNCPCHVVSFVRLGHSSVSKSKLANNILNDQYHNTFIDRDCPLGSSNRCISEGLIEAAWYLPSRLSNFVSSVTTFLNLRGDANRFHEQLTILSKISTILVILIDVNNLNETITSNSLDFLLENVNGIVIAIDAYSSTKKDVIKKICHFLKQIEQYPKKIQLHVLKIDQE